jgi:acetyltransferase-like isoleucine patch superfamily enzyme
LGKGFAFHRQGLLLVAGGLGERFNAQAEHATQFGHEAELPLQPGALIQRQGFVDAGLEEREELGTPPSTGTPTSGIPSTAPAPGTQTRGSGPSRSRLRHEVVASPPLEPLEPLEPLAQHGKSFRTIRRTIVLEKLKDKLLPLYVKLRQPGSHRYAQQIRKWYGIECGEGALFNYRVLIMDRGRIRVGRNSSVTCWAQLTTHAPPRGEKHRSHTSGNIVIGDDCVISGHLVVAPGETLTIGDGCTIAPGVTIFEDVPPYSIVKPAAPVVRLRWRAPPTLQRGIEQ